MASLMDALRGGMNQIPLPGAEDQTQGLNKLMAAKAGKAQPAGGGGPRASALGEAAATGQARAQAQQIRAQGDLGMQQVEQQVRAQDTEFKQETAQLGEARKRQQSQFASQAADLIQELKLGQKQLDADKLDAKAEQLGFATRLSSEKYITELEMAGAERRLGEQLSFEEALAHEVFGEELGALEQKLNFSDLLNMDENQFKAELGKLQIEDAIAVAQADLKGKQTAAMWGAVGGLASAGASGYGTYSEGGFDEDYQKFKQDNPGVGMSHETWQEYDSWRQANPEAAKTTSPEDWKNKKREGTL
jgi:hypothetical protein